MSGTLGVLLLVAALGLGILILLGMLIVGRRWYAARRERLNALHVRLLRSELMQAVARAEDGFLIEHWTGRDRKAALIVASQILAFLKGPDRKRLEDIVDHNGVLKRPLARLARRSEAKRIVIIRQLAAFGNDSVQATLHTLLMYDPSPHVRLEAAVGILVAGRLPSPWRIVRSVLNEGQPITPNHRLLFRRLADLRPEAVIAIAHFHDDRTLRLLAVYGLGHLSDPLAFAALRKLVTDADPLIAEAAQQALPHAAHQDHMLRRVRQSADPLLAVPDEQLAA